MSNIRIDAGISENQEALVLLGIISQMPQNEQDDIKEKLNTLKALLNERKWLDTDILPVLSLLTLEITHPKV